MKVKTYDQSWREHEGESFREVIVETPTHRVVVKEYNGKLEVQSSAAIFGGGAR